MVILCESRACLAFLWALALSSPGSSVFRHFTTIHFSKASAHRLIGLCYCLFEARKREQEATDVTPPNFTII